MKERPILFNGHDVRAIRYGRKTQTRQLVKPQPQLIGSMWRWSTSDGRASYIFPNETGFPVHSSEGMHTRCPYGQPGDRLWVRETWRRFDSNSECACYDDCRCSRFNGNPIYKADQTDVFDGVKWRSPISMPRWASRITLEIVSVRAERLQDIGDEDAEAEGINRIAHGRSGYYYSAFRNEPDPDNWCHAVPAYKELWESINGPGSWHLNPWVWVIEFKEVKP